MRRFALPLALACLTGCASSSSSSSAERPIANGADVARSVDLCRTTAAELTQRLGTPSRDGRLGTHRVMTWVVAWDPLVRTLGVLIDARGTVVDVVWDLPSEIPWTPANRCIVP